MATKRANSTGSITKHRGKYLARITLPTGKRQSVGSFPTKREAGLALARALTQLADGTYYDKDAGQATVTEWCTHWIDTHKGVWSPRTTDTYTRLLRVHIAPQIGHIKLAALSKRQVRAWSLERRSVSESQAVKAYRALRAALNVAVDDGLLAANPCQIKGAGKEVRVERPTITYMQLFELAQALPEHLYAVPITAALAALRFGELGGLQRQYVGLDQGTITVARQLQYVEGGLVFCPPKSASARVVPIPPILVDTLEVHISRFVGRGRDALVFTGQEGGRLGQRAWHHHWKRARKQVGLEHVRLHDLRHSGATWATQAGATIPDVMARLGHSTVDAAMRYQHASMTAHRGVADQMGVLAEQARQVVAGGRVGRHTPSKQLLRVVS